MNEREIIQAAIDKDAILFLGAGFSVGAENFTDTGKFLIGDALCQKLIEDGKLDVTGESDRDITDVQYISTRYIKENTKRDLLILLKSIFCCKHTGEEHNLIASLPWKKIYTTNYDDVMEEASKCASYNREALIAENKIGEVYSQKNAIIHINGYIHKVTEDDLDSTFKLTYSSYRSRSLQDSDWAIALHTDIKNAKAVLFIGYSLDYDLELQQIFACNEELKNKCMFVVLNPTPRQRTNMESFGAIYDQGLKEFSKIVKEVKSNYKPEEKEYSLKCLSKPLTTNGLIKTVSADDMIRLFVDGELKDEIIYSLYEYDYVFKRSCVDNIVEFIENDGMVAIVHSDLSNGKTVVLKQLETELKKIGNVYYIDISADTSLADDLEYIASQRGMHYILGENYNQFIESPIWDIIARYKYSNIKYVFTARSFINDNFYGRVQKDFDLDSKTLALFDINELKDDDINRFAYLITKYDLWGKKNPNNKVSNIKYIKKNCKREIVNVLLDVYKSVSVQRKIDEIIDQVFSNESAKRILLITLICNILTLPVELDDIAIILGVNQVNKLVLERNSKLREVLTIERNRINIKSSSISKYIIQSGNYNDEILQIINLMVNTFNKHIYNSKYAVNMKYIISFSNLRMIFNHKDPNLKKKYIEFYENARKTGFYKDNQFFWIQYAIAEMEVKDYAAAQLYLENASNLANKKYNQDSYQVDSLRARLYLERTIYENNSKDAFQNFKIAHDLICSNETPERDYPYRQVSNYSKFYQKYYHGFNQEEKNEFMLMCIKMKNNIDTFLNSNNGFERNVRKRNNHIILISHQLKDMIEEMAAEG